MGQGVVARSALEFGVLKEEDWGLGSECVCEPQMGQGMCSCPAPASFLPDLGSWAASLPSGVHYAHLGCGSDSLLELATAGLESQGGIWCEGLHSATPAPPPAWLPGPPQPVSLAFLTAPLTAPHPVMIPNVNLAGRQ